MTGASGSPRERILGSLRDVRRARGGAPAPSWDLFAPREPVAPSRSGDSLAERRSRFAAALRRVGGEAFDLVGAVDVRAALRDIAASLRAAAGGGPQRAAVDGDPAWARLAARKVGAIPIRAVLVEAGFEVVEVPAGTPEETRAALAGCALGVTVADLAVAETGTVAQLARPFRPRAISLLPPAHLVVLSEDRIVTAMDDLLQAAAADVGGPAGYMALVTGPSRTADIEKVLTIGVHGPGRLAVAIVEAV